MTGDFVTMLTSTWVYVNYLAVSVWKTDNFNYYSLTLIVPLVFFTLDKELLSLSHSKNWGKVPQNEMINLISIGNFGDCLGHTRAGQSTVRAGEASE